MGLLGLSVDTEGAERSTESTLRSTGAQRSADSTVRIKQYSKKGGTVFGLYGQQGASGSNPAEASGDSKALSPDSSGVSSPGSSQQGSPERSGRRVGSEPRRGQGKEQSPGSDYGSLLSDIEEDSSILKPREYPGESLQHGLATEGDFPVRTRGESLGLEESDSRVEEMPRQRRQRQRSASESISDKLSDSQAQRDKDLEDLWPESNSLDRNTSQYGNNVVAIRGVKLQQCDAFQNGCQIENKTAVATIGAKSKYSNNESRCEDKNAVEKTVSSVPCHTLHRVPNLQSNFHIHSATHSTKPKHTATSLLPKSRSFVLPVRPSFTGLRSSCTFQHRTLGCTDKLHCGTAVSGKRPESYLNSTTKCRQNAQAHNQDKTTSTAEEGKSLQDKSRRNSLQDIFLAGLTQNKCNISSLSTNSTDFTDLYSLTSKSNGCHGDLHVETSGGTSGGVGCHGSTCCLNVVQDVLNRIPITPCNSLQLLDLSSSCNTSALSPVDYTASCTSHYVSTISSTPHYATMRVKRHYSALMGNLPCWKQRHHHDDEHANVKHVSFSHLVILCGTGDARYVAHPTISPGLNFENLRGMLFMYETT